MPDMLSLKNTGLFAIVLATFCVGAALAKSGSEMLADGLQQEKEIRSNASPFSNPPDLAKVIATYTEALDSGALSKTEQIRALVHRGGIYAEQDQCSLAIADLNAAIEMGHQSARAYALRSTCHAKASAYDVAIQDLNKAVSISPKDAVLRRERALLYIEVKDFRRAAADLGDAIRLLKPLESADLFVLRGDTYQEQGAHQRAIDDYLIAIRITKKNSKQIGVPSTGRQMVQIRAIYAKIANSYRALSLAPDAGQERR